jgi:hypothetical protein
MESITTTSVHNMYGPNVGPRFKGLKCIIGFLGHDKVKLLVVKYDSKILIPLLVKYNHFLNLDVVGTYILVANDPSIFFFDIPILGANANEGLF